MGKEYDIETPTQALPAPTAKTKKALIESMHDLDDLTVAMLICIYGDQGTGKTISMMKLMQAITPPEKRILYVDSGKGWSSMLNFPELKNRVKRMRYENIEQLIALAGAIREGSPPFDSFGAVVLDEYSSMIRKDRTWIVKARAKQKADQGDFKDPFQPTQPDYLASQIRSDDVLNTFMENEIHIGFLSHEKYDKETLMMRPDFSPGAANDFQRQIHSVLRATVKLDKTTKEPVRELQLQPVGNRVSVKNRIGGLGNFAKDISEVIEAYRKWGIQTEPVNVTLTEEQVAEIAKEDELLRLMNTETAS